MPSMKMKKEAIHSVLERSPRVARHYPAVSTEAVCYRRKTWCNRNLRILAQSVKSDDWLLRISNNSR